MSSDLLTSTIPYVGIVVISDVLVIYAAYLSFSVWRGLSVPLYRSRAIWTGMLAILFGLGLTASGNVGAFIPQPYSFVAVVAIFALLYPLTILVLFFWIDRTLSTIVRLDYLRRDLLGWRKFRFLYWAFAAATLVFYFSYVATPTTSNTLVLQVASSTVYAVPFGYASLALVVGGRRTKDATFRLHAKWFGFCIASILFISVLYNFVTDPFIDSLPYIAISYGLYKMARFLVPAQRLNLDDNLVEAKATLERHSPLGKLQIVEL